MNHFIYLFSVIVNFELGKCNASRVIN